MSLELEIKSRSRELARKKQETSLERPQPSKERDVEETGTTVAADLSIGRHGAVASTHPSESAEAGTSLSLPLKPPTTIDIEKIELVYVPVAEKVFPPKTITLPLISPPKDMDVESKLGVTLIGLRPFEEYVKRPTLKQYVIDVETPSFTKLMGLGIPLPIHELAYKPRPTIRSFIIDIDVPLAKLRDVDVRSLVEATMADKLEKPPEEVVHGGDVFLPSPIKEMSDLTETLDIDRPLCIVLSRPLGDSYVESVARIAREIYRIVKGGLPEPRWISKGSKEEIENLLKAEDMIFVVDDSRCELLPRSTKYMSSEEFFKQIDLGKLIDRLRELFSQSLGFIIFHVDERYEGEFYERLRGNVGKSINVIEIRPLVLHPEVKEEIVKVCWGFVDVEGKTFDEMFLSAEKSFRHTLKLIGNDIKLKHFIRYSPGTSEEHEDLKTVVVLYLARRYGATDRDKVIEMLRGRKIVTEYELGGGYRADVYDSIGDEYIEIETLYGAGANPIWRKIDNETLRKYVNLGKSARVIVVLIGLRALLYARQLLELEEAYRKHHGVEVNFTIPDLKNLRLVPLKDVLKELKKRLKEASISFYEITSDLLSNM